MLLLKGLILRAGVADYIEHRPSVSGRKFARVRWTGNPVVFGTVRVFFGCDRNFRQEFQPSSPYNDSVAREITARSGRSPTAGKRIEVKLSCRKLNKNKR
jgi:hypothetical protein